jgi:glycosyltransferase involved in cell wall biosynthesis
VADGVNEERFAPIAGDAARRERVEQLRNELGLPPGRPVVVYLGLLAEYQGTTHLLRAAETIVHQGTDVHFLIMGHPGEERYRALADRLGIGNRVTFTGAIRYEAAADYLALGTVAVSPKLSLTEGNGKLLNYIAMGLPTVAYESPVSRQILGDDGVYAPAGDWSALAIELQGALADQSAAHSRGKALRRRALAEHRWADRARTLLDVYGSLLDSSGARGRERRLVGAR